MMQPIILPHRTRYFTRHGNALCRTDKYLEHGLRIHIGRMEKLSYDHQDKEAVPFRYLGRDYYLLVEELHIKGLAARLRARANLRLVSSKPSKEPPP